jgi:hypothetical protein
MALAAQLQYLDIHLQLDGFERLNMLARGLTDVAAISRDASELALQSRYLSEDVVQNQAFDYLANLLEGFADPMTEVMSNPADVSPKARIAAALAERIPYLDRVEERLDYFERVAG